MKTLAEQYDCLLVDLDGTVFRGSQPTEGAVQSLSEVKSRTLFVTNNATRSAEQVAAHLVTKFRHALIDQRLVQLVVAVHAGRL